MPPNVVFDWHLLGRTHIQDLTGRPGILEEYHSAKDPAIWQHAHARRGNYAHQPPSYYFCSRNDAEIWHDVLVIQGIQRSDVNLQSLLVRRTRRSRYKHIRAIHAY